MASIPVASILPWLVPLLLVLAAITVWPPLTLWLPRILMDGLRKSIGVSAIAGSNSYAMIPNPTPLQLTIKSILFSVGAQRRLQARQWIANRTSTNNWRRWPRIWPRD